VRTLGDGFTFVEDRYGETQTRTIDHDDFDFGANDESDGNRFVMFEVDVGAERDEVERTSTPLFPAFSAVIHSSTRDCRLYARPISSFALMPGENTRKPPVLLGCSGVREADYQEFHPGS